MKRMTFLAALLLVLAALVVGCTTPAPGDVNAVATQAAGLATQNAGTINPALTQVTDQATQLAPTVNAAASQAVEMATMAAPTVDAALTQVAPEVDAAATQAMEMATMAAATMEAMQATPVSGDTGTDDDTLADVDPSGQTVIFWHQHTGGREEALNALVADFNETNEYGITVEAQQQGTYDDIYNKMIAGLQSGELPQLTVAYQNQAAAYQTADGLVDLAPYISSPTWGLSEEERADFFESFIQSDYNASEEAQLGFPPNRSMEVLFYNADMLSELGFDGPPTNWEEFQEQACAATEAGNEGYQLSLDASRFASFVFSQGGALMNEEQSEYTLNSEEAVAAMTFMQGLFDAGCATIVAEDFGDQSALGAGDLLFAIGSSSGIPFYRDAVEAGYGGEFGVAAIPHTTPDPVQNIYGASVSMPVSTPEQQLAAWIFLKYYTSAEVQTEWARASNYFPVRRSVADGLEDYFGENPQYQAAFELLEYGVSEPPVASYDVVRDLISEAMAEIVEGADVQETLDDLNEEANQVLADFVVE